MARAGSSLMLVFLLAVCLFTWDVSQKLISPECNGSKLVANGANFHPSSGSELCAITAQSYWSFLQLTKYELRIIKVGSDHEDHPVPPLTHHTVPINRVQHNLRFRLVSYPTYCCHSHSVPCDFRLCSPTVQIHPL